MIPPLLSYGSDAGSSPMDALMKIVKWMLFNHIQSLCNVGICRRWLEGRARTLVSVKQYLVFAFIELYFNFRTKFHYLEGEL